MNDHTVEQSVAPNITTEQNTTTPLPEGGKIIWNDQEMKSSYANVVNVAATADEFMLLFGTNDAWNNVQKDVRINLHARIIMTPVTIKRLQLLINKTVEEYERKNAAKNG